MDSLKNPDGTPLLSMYVEDCFRLRMSDLGRGVLKADGSGKAKTGAFFLADGAHIIRLEYEIELTSRSPMLHLKISRGPESVVHYQVILLTSQKHGYGHRPFFYRKGVYSRTLYARIDLLTFGTRKEMRLRYRSSNRKPQSPLGQCLFQLERMRKINEVITQVRHVTHAGKLTRKARSVVHMKNKWLQIEKQR